MAERKPPGGVDVTTPNSARIYDYILGGKDNFAADRAAAKEILKAFPEARDGARSNRRFSGNTVRFLAREAGIRQFIDIGAGLPTQDNVHQAAQSVTPDARVVYVDKDPVVCVHGRAILADSLKVAIIEADLMDAEKIVAGAGESGLIDWGQPVGVLLMAVLHHIADPYDAVAKIRAAMAPGSYLVISHLTRQESRSQDTDQLLAAYRSVRSTGVYPRTVDEIKRLFGNFEQIEPADLLEPRALRRYAALGWGGIARKP